MNHDPLKATLAIFALGVLIPLAIFYFQPQADALAYGACLVMGAAALGSWLGLPSSQEFLAPPQSPPNYQRRWTPMVLGACVALSSCASLYLFASIERPQDLAWYLYLASLVFMIMLAFSFGGTASSRSQTLSKIDLLSVLVLLVIATFPRFYQLTELPYGYWYDDAQSSLVAIKILDSSNYLPVFVPDLGQAPALIFYLYALAIKIIGLGDTPIVPVRVVTSLLAIGSVLSVWLLARELFGRWYGFFAGLILAIMRWHLTFSRFGTIAITPTLFGPLALYFFVRAYRQVSRRDAILCGITLGIGLQFYFAMFVIPILIGLSAAHRFVMTPIKAKAWGLVVSLLVLSSVVVYSPMIQYALTNWGTFSQRMNTVSIASKNGSAESSYLETVKKTTIEHLRMFHFEGDRNGRHNYPGSAMLDSITGALFVIGCCWAIWRIFRPTFAMLLAWFFGSIATGILSLSFESPQGARTVGVTAVVAILAAIPLGRIAEKMVSIQGKSLQVITAAGLFLLMGTAACLNFDYYFNHQLSYPAGWTAYSTADTRIGFLLRDEGDDAEIYTPDTLSGGPTQTLLAGRERKTIPFHGGLTLPLRTVDKSAIVITSIGEDALEKAMHTLYPEASVERLTPPSSEDVAAPSSILTITRIPQAALSKIRRWKVSVVKDGETIQTDTSVDSEWDWSQFRADAPVKIFVEGALRIDTFGESSFLVQGSGSEKLTIDETPIVFSSKDEPVSLSLAKGTHYVQLEFEVDGSPGKTTLSMTNPRSGRLGPIEQENMFSPETYIGGLLASYYKGIGEDRTLAYQQIDPQVAFYFHELPIPRPFSVTWRGRIHAPRSGTYQFGTKSIDRSEVKIDGVSIVKNDQKGPYLESEIELQAGWHEIEVLYSNINNYSQVYLYWTPPGGTQELVGQESLRPLGPEVVSRHR